MRLRIEEYSPIAGFIKDSFATDRVAMAVRFAKFTPQYEIDFNTQRQLVINLESTLVLTNDQKNVTIQLYNKADEINAELNFLSFYYKDAGFDTKIITKTKKNLINRNIEGSCLNLKDIIQFITINQAVLESKGMANTYITTLNDDKLFLEKYNEMQNKVLNAVKSLYEKNKTAYENLYTYISTISEAGKIIFKGQVKADQYTISKLIKRMRSGN